MAPPPLALDRIWTSPTDPLPLSPAQAHNHAAHFLHKYQGSGGLYSLPRVPRSKLGWHHPQWFTKSRYPSPLAPGRGGLWYRVLQLANDDLTRIALRDTCKHLQQLASDFDYARLSIQRVAFDGRNPKRIFALDFVAAKYTHDTSELEAYPVLREIPKTGRERAKVILAGSIHFELSIIESFKRPRYISEEDWFGESSSRSVGTGVRTPGRHVLLENHVCRDTIICGRSGKENHEGELTTERWIRERNLRAPVVKLAEDESQASAYRERALLDECEHRLQKWEEKGKDPRLARQRGPRPPDVDFGSEQQHMKWEAEALDGEGLEDTFTLEEVAHIVTGRFKGSSSTFSNWSDGFAEISQAWRKGGPLLLSLYPHIHGWLAMDATFPYIEDAGAGRLGYPSWTDPAIVGLANAFRFFRGF